jgi:RimJ/RimL family protein N-acetyltransferase
VAKIEIITGWDAALAHWVGQNLEMPVGADCVSLGFADGPELLAAVVYHNLIWPNIEGSIFSTSPRWANRRTLFACFYHPFIAMRCQRFGAIAAVANQPSRAFLCRLGFQLEGTARQAVLHQGKVCDAEIYGMPPHECRWLGRLRPPAPELTAEGASEAAAD